MATTSALCISRSTIETTQAAFGKISRHSAKCAIGGDDGAFLLVAQLASNS